MPSWARTFPVRKNEPDRDKTVSDVILVELARIRSNQGDLAPVLGLSQPAIHRRMAGKVAWRIDELTKVAGYLGIAVSALLPEQVSA